MEKLIIIFLAQIACFERNWLVNVYHLKYPNAPWHCLHAEGIHIEFKNHKLEQIRTLEKATETWMRIHLATFKLSFCYWLFFRTYWQEKVFINIHKGFCLHQTKSSVQFIIFKIEFSHYLLAKINALCFLPHKRSIKNICLQIGCLSFVFL